jgi:effector-binding domain-containing protein
VPVSELRALLARKQGDIHQQIQDEQARLARVDARLRQIEEDNSPPKYEIVLKTMAPQRIASARQIVPHVSRMGELRDLPLRELYDWLKRNRITDYDIEVMIYNITEYVEENIDMQSCVILGRGADQVSRAQDARVRVEILPAAEMATTVHHGYPSDGTNGYRSCGPIRELHLNGREIDLCDAPASVLQSCVMEIQIPVETAS